MKQYKDQITFNRNSRGCYILDTTKGCSAGKLNFNKGCYSDCYAKNIADRYGFDFNKVKKRRFEEKKDQLYFFDLKDVDHVNKIIKKIKAIKMPFVRIGEMGDPSDDWAHTVEVCKEISKAGKPIVIITKHWKVIPDNLLNELSNLNICINTSVSALDTFEQIEHRIIQFKKLIPYCNSILRVVSCEFNQNNEDGRALSILQDWVFRQGNYIDTIFRPSNKNPLVINGVIKTSKVKFLKSNVLASVFNKKTYFGKCTECPEMCGIYNKNLLTLNPK